MTNAAIAENTNFVRTKIPQRLDPQRRSQLGQFMTPMPVGRFMASLFADVSGYVHVLDPGAGVGSLTASIAERLSNEIVKPLSASFTCYEIDKVLINYLRNTLNEAKQQCGYAGISVDTEVRTKDFIIDRANTQQPDIFNDFQDDSTAISHVIMNPPYKKIGVNSEHRNALRQAGIETSNLYTAFMLLAARQLRPGGELVAIIPRSFCNGPYFRSFRQHFFSTMSLRQIHIFEKRDSAFREDKVLQENIIVHAVKGTVSRNVLITTSRGADFHRDTESGQYVADDMTRHVVGHSAIIRPNDPELFVHIVANNIEQSIFDRMAALPNTFADLGVEVATGPVVDFRLRNDLCYEPEDGAAPLLYPGHFQCGALEWPKVSKKPNAIRVSSESRRWLWDNEGCFVVTKRFSSKEERRRIVASVYSSDLPGALIGFENHLNVFHRKQKGVSKELACGLCLFLNSSLVDRFFRQFNGHTQVNAADLRFLRYPDEETLCRMGKDISSKSLSQREIDQIIENEVIQMADDNNPLLAQQKIEDALEILRALGMPKRQQNERSALTLLALVDLKPSGVWDDLKMPLRGITPVMDYILDNYGREYAPNTRETFRRQTMHQFVEAGIALYNPDDPNRAVNSPKACYQISAEVFQVIRSFGTDDWDATLVTYLENQKTLAAKWAMHREMQKIPVCISGGLEITLTPGAHSQLIRDIIDEFAPRFAPASEVIYVGDTGEKIGYFEEQRLAELGVRVDRHGKMPDVVLYYGERNWLLLVEAVTSHGPVDAKRYNELAALFSDSQPGLVYVTAFPDRSVMARYLPEICWETEVWCANAPTHLIHFNGEKFLGPYKRQMILVFLASWVPVNRFCLRTLRRLLPVIIPKSSFCIIT